MKKQGHISDHMSLLDIAKKHNITDSELRSEHKKGIKVEQEHTSNIKTATRIALDHLFEDPKYYTKLAKIKLEENESSSKSYMYLDQIVISESNDLLITLINNNIISVIDFPLKDKDNKIINTICSSSFSNDIIKYFLSKDK